MSASGWMLEKLDLNINLIIYFLLFYLFFLFRNELISYVTYLFKKKLASIDTLILISILLHFAINKSILVPGLSFTALFIFFSSLGSSNRKKNMNIVLKSIMIVSFLTVIGVLIGYAKGIQGSPSIFYTVQPHNYPSPTLDLFNTIFGTNWKYQISGFQLSINYTAYMLIAALALIDFTNTSKLLKMISYVIIIFALILSQAKVGYLFLALIIVNKFRNFFYTFLILISCGYLMLAHFTISHSEMLIENAHYFRERIFSFGDYDVYLSFFSWLKLVALEYLHSVKWFFGDYYKLVDLISADPHSFWISLLLISGPISTALVVIKFFKIEKKIRANRASLPSIFYIGVYTLLVETLIWDAFDAPIFWIILLSSTSLFLTKERNSIQGY